MTQLTSLEEGKQKPTIYFTQGHGELDLKDSNPRSQTGAGEMKKRMEERNFVVNSLSIDAPDAKVPTDATMVVIAGPKNLFSDYALKALDQYMGKGGKMIVLIGPNPNRERTEMEKTGLEPLLARFNVKVGNERVLSLPNRTLPRMTDIIVRGNPELSSNPLVKPFEDIAFPLIGGTRPIEPISAGRGMPAQLNAEPLLVTCRPARFGRNAT